MRQIWIPRHGDPDVLEVRHSEDPIPGDGEVLIRVHACGINFADIMARMGLYPDAPKPPCVVGYEVSGVVEACGEGVNSPRVGERVMALTPFGGYSDCVVIKKDYAVPIPDAISFEVGASLGVAYLTAWIVLMEQAHLNDEETVLIHGIGGGVGIAALQMAKMKNAQVIGTASSHKHKRLEEMGANDLIDPREEDFEKAVMTWTKGRGVDVVLDSIGGSSFKKSYRCLAPLGRLGLFGVSSLAPSLKRRLLPAIGSLLALPRFRPIQLMNENRTVIGVHLGHLWSEDSKIQRFLKHIVGEVDRGSLAPVIDRCFSFDEAADAHRFIQSRKNIGKVLLTTGDT